MKTWLSRQIDSPVGPLKLVASDAGLAAILWPNDDPARVRLGEPVENASHPVLLEAERQLREYFEGRRRMFDLKLDFSGTEFQRKVWAALLTIPYGETRSYAQIARQVGRPNAVRAVGAANGKNPISIVAPCHRVIGSTGKLTGFAGGLETKAFLLALEGPQPQLPVSGSDSNRNTDSSNSDSNSDSDSDSDSDSGGGGGRGGGGGGRGGSGGGRLAEARPRA